MTQPNPYAPPATTEPEAPSSGTWHLDGAGLLAKDKVILPRVDLETGERSDDLKCIHRSFQGTGPLVFLRVVILIALYLIVDRIFHLDSLYLILLVLAASLVLQRIPLLRGNSGGRVVIWEFVGGKAAKGRVVRQKWRVAIGFLVSLLVIISSAAPSSIASAEMYLPLLGLGVLAMVALRVWGLVDRSRAKSLTGPPGWMRIAPIHPDALAYLSRLESEPRRATS